MGIAATAEREDEPMGTGMGRRRERDQVAEVARRRLALLEAELAGIRPQVGVDPGWADPHDAGEPEAEPRTPRTPGQHRHAPGAPDPVTRPAVGPVVGPTVGRRPPLRPGRPGALHDPVEAEEERVVVRPSFARVDDIPEPGPQDGLPDWLADRIPETLRGRAALSGRAVLALAVLVLAVLGVVGWTTLRPGGGDPVPQAQVRTVAGAASPSPSASPAGGAASGGPAAAASSAPSAGADVVVDVAGKVRRPGIVTLPTGSRVHEAIQRAGGARPGVNLTSINLARVLVDGEQIVVGARGAAAAPATGTAGPGGTTGSATGTSGSASGTGGALVNLNTADATALDTLPGVGEVTAQKILDWRTSHGTFTSVDELLDVDGIGEKTLADIKPHVTV